MSASSAIVTIALGEEYIERWQRYCEPNWREYADRHGYDLICITEPLDDSQRARDRSPSWQKLLVPGQPFAAGYEQLVWVDADCIFTSIAPSITAHVPLSAIGAADELDVPIEARDYFHTEPMETYYGEFGLPGSFEHIVQAGVMVLSPRHHRELFEHVYYAYEDQGEGMWYEMRPLSFEIQQAGLEHWLDSRFNTIWSLHKAQLYPFMLEFSRHPRTPEALARALENYFIVHFAGEQHQMDFVLGERERPVRRAPRADPPPARTPVALFVNRRPDRGALDTLRAVRPPRLMLIADAPEGGEGQEPDPRELARGIADGVDWQCEVQLQLADAHLGHNRRTEHGLDWVFAEVEEAIVLEDDCAPDPSFFRFCDELLGLYRDDERVMSVTGSNYEFRGPGREESYYFSRYMPSWGWASWRRAWAQHDSAMGAWPRLREEGWLQDMVAGPYAVAYWTQLLEQAHTEGHRWDRAWWLACAMRGGLHATPGVNLVTELGPQGDRAGPDPDSRELLWDLPTEAMAFPLIHPEQVRRDETADAFHEKVAYSGRLQYLFRRIRHTRRELTAR